MSDFGALLKQAREHRGISLRQIATATKISITALDALERDDFSRLPGGIFSRAFVRAYAIEVGLDPDATVEQFLVQAGRMEDERAEPAPLPVSADDQAFVARQQMAARFLQIGLIVLGVVVVALIIWFVSRGARHTTASEKPPVATVAVDAPSADSRPVSSVASSAITPLPAKAGEMLSIDLEATGKCWTRVTVDGADLFHDSLNEGERQHFDATREIVLQVGDAGAMKWRINGKVARSLGGAGEVKQATINRATIPMYVR